ncbi:MAG TPA: hypothetical protein VFK20_15085 [Vicinamibacterales bacterium]|nr:hypothetical protein [Vicinamibacterales bacterium]
MTRIETIEARVHGRYAVEEGDPARVLAGFHGYGQNAGEMLDHLRTIAPAGWTIVSVQGLHRFYRPRSRITVASWMTREDRDLLIADTIAYVDAVIDAVAGPATLTRLVYCGFSQGVATAFRAAVRGRRRADAVIALGGDVPPELLEDHAAAFPRTLLARGRGDLVYGDVTLERDRAALDARGTIVETFTADGGHEWTDAFRARAAALLHDLA